MPIFMNEIPIFSLASKKIQEGESHFFFIMEFWIFLNLLSTFTSQKNFGLTLSMYYS